MGGLTLNMEQALHLRKDLGLDMSDASLVLIYKDYDGENEVDWEDITMVDGKPYFFDCGDEYELHGELYDAECGDYDHSYREDCAVYTLQEILGKLPKMIVCDGGTYFLKYDFQREIIHYSTYNELCCLVSFDKDKLENAYELLCWVIKNGHLKTK